jgi:hypothetical protein
VTAKASALTAASGVRAQVAEEIAAAIEESVCEPGGQCAERFCPDCTRYRQAQADAATARRIGGAAGPVPEVRALRQQLADARAEIARLEEEAASMRSLILGAACSREGLEVLTGAGTGEDGSEEGERDA